MMRMRRATWGSSFSRRIRQVVLLVILLVILEQPVWLVVQAIHSCDSDRDCQEYYSTYKFNQTTSSICLPSGFCSNPFQQGCLHTVLGKSPRLCNSDDSKSVTDDSSAKSYNDVNDASTSESDTTTTNNSSVLLPSCSKSGFAYKELRIHQADWESSLFQAWIYQIILMEIAGVPATVGLTTDTTPHSSFYATENTLDRVFSTVGYPFDALQQSNRQRNFDCATTLEPCVHVLPDVWSRSAHVRQYVQNGTIDEPTGNGQIGQFRFFVPEFTAKAFPSLGIYLGFQGEKKRQLLADLFQRPTTWLDYCRQVSPTNCTTPDATAIRFPIDSKEQELYFLEDVFTGHFRPTQANDCVQHSTSCTGHIILPPCTWSANPEVLLYWNEIVGLQADGPLQPHGGYTSSSMDQVWRAANATKSHVIMLWYQPSALLETFGGTAAAFQQVVFPTPTKACTQKYRLEESRRCSKFAVDRRGDPYGACDYEPFILQRLIAMSVVNSTALAAEAERSPAHQVLTNFKMTELDVNTIFDDWLQRGDAREAVCNWVVENYEALTEFVPEGYPKRRVSSSDYGNVYLVAVRTYAGFVAFVTLCTVLQVIRYRNARVMIYAQPVFILLILVGFLCIASGAFLLTFKPDRKVCTAAIWLIEVGYTVELVPVVVKTAAINQLVNAYSKQKSKRIHINRRLLLVKVAVMVSVVLGFLITWTIMDPPKAVESSALSPTNPEEVIYDLKCSSSTPTWRLIVYSWELFLLLIAAVLAFQSRSILKEFNDSKTLGIMVYSHALFMLLRGVLSFLYEGSSWPSSTIAAGFTVNYCLDTLVAMSIYVLPKIYYASQGPNALGTSKMLRKVSRDSVGVSAVDQSAGELKVLVCTANLGNAQPTLESMEEWIPTGGVRVVVNPLAEGAPLLRGNFDLIAIGMQESTWESTSASARRLSTTDPTRQSMRMSKRVLTTSEGAEGILNAMEDQNRTALREMVQDILGDDYYQVAEEERGQMRLHLWASGAVVDDIEHIKISGANTGIGNLIANKGGIVVTLTYKKTRISFLSAHLAAHEGDSYYRARCRSVRTILREAKTFDLSKKLDVSVSSHHMFVMGDLNFRTDFGQESNHQDRLNRAMFMIDHKDYDELYKYDELQRGLREGDLLVNFNTLQCPFAPTFKMERRSGCHYTRQRVPSYTDRVLFKSAEALEANLIPESYESCVNFVTSDHKPIRAAFSIVPNGIEEIPPKWGEVRLTFRKMECRGLPAADSNGLSDPYLMFLWDSVDLESVLESFEDKMRKVFLGKSWPRTKYIPKTLDPKWKGQQVVLTSKNVNVGPEAMLFVVAMDYDSLTIVSDDFLGVLALNVKDLFARGLRDKELLLDRQLVRDGKCTGRIKFKLNVEHVKKSSKRFTIRRSSTIGMP
jgi:hypothetical protein